MKQPDEAPDSEAPAGHESDKYIGRTIDGRYVVESVLGEGGMGVVYKCRRKVFDKAVAIKILRADVAKTPEVLDRFVTEAKAASAIGNAHIVDVFDFGETPDGSTYFAMEYLEGHTLGGLIADSALGDSKRVVAIGRQMAEGLAAAHEAQIVHRDLKPDNVFITQRDGSDFVKILDFGIAKVAGLESKITRAGAVFGTPHYMSPEQCRGSAVDARTDIYSLGVILYEMVAGRVPFDAENPLSILSMHMNEPATRFSQIDPPAPAEPGLEPVILKCLAKRPEERFQTMSEVEHALAAVERGEALEIDVPISIAPPEDASAPAPALVVPPPSAPAGAASADDSGRLSFVGDVRASLPGDALPLSQRAPSRVAHDLERALREAEEERRLAAARRSRRWAVFGGVFVLLALGAGALTYLGSLPVATLNEAVQAGRPILFAGHLAKPEATQSSTKVALVLAPIDAHVFRDGHDLGSMPVEVEVKSGERVQVEVRRSGYWPRKVRLDGSRAKVTVRLAPTTSPQPSAQGTAATAPSAAAGNEAAPNPATTDDESSE